MQLILSLLVALFFSPRVGLVGAASTSAGISTVVDYFDKAGFVVLRQQFKDWQLEHWQNFANEHFKSIFFHLYEQGRVSYPAHTKLSTQGSSGGQEKREYTMEEGPENGFSEIVMTSPGRFEMSLEDAYHPPIDFIMTQLSDLVPALLHSSSNTIKIEDLNVHLSLVVSTPEAAAEPNWYSDGDHLDLDEHSACYGVTLVIPLGHVTPEQGTTEVLTASHYYTRLLEQAAATAAASKRDKMTTKIDLPRQLMQAAHAPALPVGDVLLWDFRTLHRAKANKSSKNQPLLVITLAQPSVTNDKINKNRNWPTNSLFGDE